MVVEAARKRMAIRPEKLHLVPEKEQRIQSVLLGEFSELETWMSMLWRLRAEFQQVSGVLESSPHGRLDPGNPEHVQKLRRLQEHLRLTAETALVVKAMYEWLYHLREQLEQSEALRAHLSAATWQSLVRTCEYRNSLVTHKTDLKMLPMGGIRYSPDLAKFEIMSVPWQGLPETANQELQRLYEEAAPFLAEEARGEQNTIERMGILYRELSRLPGPLQGRVKLFIGQYGTIADSPNTIAELVASLAEEVLPHCGVEEVRG